MAVPVAGGRPLRQGLAAPAHGAQVRRAALLLLLALALAGCGGPDRVLPGVRTEARITDSFQCGVLVVPEGCPIVRLPRVESGCAPEAGGYALCNATLDWTATSGAALPGSRLEVRVGGEPAGACEPAPGRPCALRGNATYSHHFGGAGQKDVWATSFVATLAAPGGSSQAGGTFALALELAVRTEGGDALTE
jgi:hypothetical protein